MQIVKLVFKYISKFFQLWLIWFWFFVLDFLGLIIDTFVPSFSPPQWLYLIIPAIGFVIANIKMFYNHEQEKAQLTKHIKELEDNFISPNSIAILPSKQPWGSIVKHILGEEPIKILDLLITYNSGGQKKEDKVERFYAINQDQSKGHITNGMILRLGEDMFFDPPTDKIDNDEDKVEFVVTCYFKGVKSGREFEIQENIVLQRNLPAFL